MVISGTAGARKGASVRLRWRTRWETDTYGFSRRRMVRGSRLQRERPRRFRRIYATDFNVAMRQRINHPINQSNQPVKFINSKRTRSGHLHRSKLHVHTVLLLLTA